MMVTAGSDARAPRRRARGASRTALALLVALTGTLAVVAAPAPAGAATQTVSNTTAMTIPAGGTAAPDHSAASLYPSPVTVSGLTGTTTKVTVTLTGLSHDLGRDVDVLLVAPTGQSTVVMSDIGENAPVSGATLTFDDAAASTHPASGSITSGTYKPTNHTNGFSGDEWPSPAPAGPYGTTFAAFNGINPNGTWNLFVADDANGDAGSLSGGWSLTVETGVTTFPGQIQLSNVEYRGTEGGGTAAVTLSRVSGDDGEVGVTFTTGTGTATAGLDYTAVSQTVTFADGDTSETVNVPIVDDPSVEGIDELIPISISAPTGGATLGTPTSGQIRLQDNDARGNAFTITTPASGSLGASDPYPSNIVVGGASGVVTDVDVELNDVSHTHIRDLDVLLVAPNGATTMLMQDVGPNTPVSALELTFSDEAAGGIGQAGLASGTYRPSQFDDEIAEALPAPAPAGPWGTDLAALDGTSPNGTWSLYVHDDAGGDVGDIGGGWSLTLETATASAGGPYSSAEGAAVTLSGATTPALTGATYEWDVDGDGQFDDATGQNPTVSAATLAGIGLGDGPDSSNVRLRVTSGSAVITSAATTLTITNAAPTATFGNNGPVALGSTAEVTFTGQADPSSADTTAGFRYSYDFDDDGDWEVGDGTYAGGSTSASATVPSSVLNAVGTFDVNGRIMDKDGGFTDSTTTITVTAPPNALPEADAGPDQEVNGGDTVTLDGTGSTDADDDELTYSWAQTGGTAVTLTGATTAQPTFTAPAGPATLTFELTVDDGEAGPATDTVTITVNGIPTADAGPDQDANLGDTVTLDGTGSTDPDGDTLTYSWEQTGGGTVVVLTGADTAQPTFTAPEGPDTLAFAVTVTDPGGETDTDAVIITINGPPTADAGADQDAQPGDTVTLDGTGSADPDGDTLLYSWVQTAGPAVTLVGANTATPSFTAPAGPGTVTFELTVDDGQGRTDTDEVSVGLNDAPTADAGADQTVQAGDTVTLDGTGSTDPESGPLTYAWVQTAGTAVTLTGATTSAPTFTAPASGTLTFELTVTDDGGLTDTDTVDVAVNRAPTADAGPDQDVNGGDTVSLDGTGSTDPDGDTLTYAWDQITGTAVTLTGATTASPTFSAPTGPAVLTFRLVVDDGRGGVDLDVVTVVVNGIPTADAGPDQDANAGDTVTLDGTGSTDPDGDTLTYSWAQTGGTAVTLTGATTAQPTFTAPAGPATLTFELTVDDGNGETDTDTVTITVNGIPTADAGPDQDANAGDTVTLDGTGSTDPDGDTLTYSWAQTAGTAVTLTGATTAQPTFTAPAGPATLTFELTVDDGEAGPATDTVTITVNGIPTADAGPDQHANLGDTVTLDGTGSTDPDGDTLTYSWEQTGGGTVVVLTGADTAQPTFTAPEGRDTLAFAVTVTDPGGETDTDAVIITINGPPTADAGSDQAASLGDTVTLDGTGSTDPDGDTLTYSWAQTAGPAVILVGATTSQPTFVAPAGPATATFVLTVDDGQGRTDTDEVSVSFNGAPIADAGEDQAANAGDTVTLDGTGSSDPEGDDLTYSWTQTDGPTVTLTDPTTSEPTFTAPEGPATLTFELTVTDEDGLTGTDTVTVTVNGPPTADAGPDQLVNAGDTVTLDGTGSTDPDADTLTSSWVQDSGPDVTLTGPTTATPTFTAPEGPAVLVFTLTIDDGEGRTDTDTVTITVNGPPTADAGGDEDVVERTEATLDGTGSTDPDGDDLSYAWTQTSGPTVTLDGAATATATFTVPDAPASLAFELTVTDELGRSDTDTVVITSLPRFTPDEAFVEHTYRVLLGRDADPEGRAYWAARLADGTTRTAVARLVGFSTEATQGRVLDQRYQAWLGRPADDAARAFWTPRLRDGQPIVDLERSILASGELYQRGGGSDAGYVGVLYELLLGRAPSATDLAFWEARVASRGRTSVAGEILGSNESERRRVATAYEEMLGRPADPGGLTFWTGVLDETRDLRRVEVRLAAAWVNQPGSSV
ncbi:DUF4214 domain-containing protein [Iamia sp. SCSIO 61187]|uniref:PKD domain-containing protein n=1 Tax=Iamia sp. SCSIO 61187 TaxID=2722752 RepID=UPI001C631DAA|nr:PKD domain-containing protein [Iamia sp. SCSIO 61187]QYG91867.1 DUF4214 domain-containing protein [Iamia sp. SCSIO 61187]